MSVSKYQEIYRQFEIYNRDIRDMVVDWQPMGKNSIKVFLSNGDVYQYNSIMRTRRLIRQTDGEVLTEQLFRKKLAINLAGLMYESGHTQETLSQELGVSRMILHKYLHGEATPSAYILTKLLLVLDCTIDDLMQD